MTPFPDATGAGSRGERPPEDVRAPPCRGDDDSALVAAAITGSRPAFQQLFERYHRLISVLVYQKVPHGPDVEDLVQETFLRAWRGLPNLRKPNRFLPWLVRIARRLVADWHRSMAREPARSAHSLDTVARHEDPARGLQQAEDRRHLLRALERLPERYRLALTLRFLEGMTPHAIAERLGEPSGTIRNRIFRGLRKLGRVMDQDREKGR